MAFEPLFVLRSPLSELRLLTTMLAALHAQGYKRATYRTCRHARHFHPEQADCMIHAKRIRNPTVCRDPIIIKLHFLQHFDFPPHPRVGNPTLIYEIKKYVCRVNFNSAGWTWSWIPTGSIIMTFARDLRDSCNMLVRDVLCTLTQSGGDLIPTLHILSFYKGIRC
jgi:hypothetical protein